MLRHPGAKLHHTMAYPNVAFVTHGKFKVAIVLLCYNLYTDVQFHHVIAYPIITYLKEIKQHKVTTHGVSQSSDLQV